MSTGFTAIVAWIVVPNEQFTALLTGLTLRALATVRLIGAQVNGNVTVT
jgi:hypothetical protein